MQNCNNFYSKCYIILKLNKIDDFNWKVKNKILKEKTTDSKLLNVFLKRRKQNIVSKKLTQKTLKSFIGLEVDKIKFTHTINNLPPK